MDTGQISMMPVNAGIATLASAQPSSPLTALPGVGEQVGGGHFIGVLEAMTPQNTPQKTGVAVSDDKGVSASEKDGETVSTTAVQDGVSGLMAGLLNALDAAGKPLATGTEHGAEVRTAANGSGKKTQNVVLNADGLQLALLIQVNSGRTPQTNDTVEQQAGTSLQPATEGSVEVPEPADTSDTGAQAVAVNAAGVQTSSLLVQVNDTASAVAAMGVMSVMNVAGDGGLNPTGSVVNSGQSAMAEVDTLKGSSADSPAREVVFQGREPQLVSQKEADTTAQPALPSRQVSTSAGQKDPAVGSGMVATERGNAPNGQKNSSNNVSAPVSGSASPVKGGAEVSTTPPSGVEVTAQPHQEATLFRSASLEVALAESTSRNEVGTTGPAQNGSSAQNTPVAQMPATSADKVTQTEAQQQDTRTARSGVVPVPVTLPPASPQQTDQAVRTNDHILEGTSSVQAAVVPVAEKMGVEAGAVVQTQPESATAAKPVQSIAVEAVKFAGPGTSGQEFSTGGDKGTADNFMNGQFHAGLMHQQGNADGVSTASNVSTPVQNDAQQSGLSEQILQQVRDRLVNHDVKAGNDQIVLKLSPENLGDLKVNLTMDGQRLKVEIVAENHMVRDTLLQNSDSLKESLARQNISMESFNVTTNGRGAGNPGQGQQNDWREFAQQKQQNARMSSGGYRLPDVPAVPSQLAYQTPSQHTMVDLHF